MVDSRTARKGMGRKAYAYPSRNGLLQRRGISADQVFLRKELPEVRRRSNGVRNGRSLLEKR